MSAGAKVFALLPLVIAAGAPVSGQPPLSCSPGPFVIFFGRGFAKLDAESTSILDDAIRQRGNCGSSQAFLLGHTDTSERRDVSRKRAETTRGYLITHGFPMRDITIAWRGSDKLRLSTPPNTAERQNRWVEITYGPSHMDLKGSASK
jgi:outer membrane protein OmpA-like peptidoglycan-associated protein